MKRDEDKLPPYILLNERIQIYDTTVFTATKHGKQILIFPESISDELYVKILEYLRDEGWIDELVNED